MFIKFPANFLWGSGISSYQTEGNNPYSDWTLWEKRKHLTPANEACRHYQLFSTDFDLAAHLGHNTLRLSLEWARIFPQEDMVSGKEVNHYLEVIKALKKRNLTPIVTLHHFTNPIWFAKKRGWLTPKSIDYFLKYVITVGEMFKDSVKYWVIFNEPLVYIYNGFITGIWPPGYASLRKAVSALKNILKAYILAYKELKKLYDHKDCAIAIAKHIRIFSPCSYYNIGQNHLSAFLRNKVFNFWLLRYLLKHNALDFLGLNYYCREYVEANFNIFGRECKKNHHKERKNTLGWNIYPQGLYKILIMLRRYQIPVMITENGSSEEEDTLYEEFLTVHLKAVANALKENSKVIGYMWWSLLDNFEWDKGFHHRFGLLSVDFTTFERKIKPFAWVYKQICERNGITI